MILSELIMTRVAHDLAGISGALFNTAELLEMDPSFGGEAGGLLKETTGNLLARLRLFRALFGVETKEVTTALAVDYFKTVSAVIKLEGVIESRIQLGAVIAASESLIRGGVVRVSETGVVAEGQIHLDEATRGVIAGEKELAGPRQAILVWLQEYAVRQGVALVFQVNSQEMTLKW